MRSSWVLPSSPSCGEARPPHAASDWMDFTEVARGGRWSPGAGPARGGGARALVPARAGADPLRAHLPDDRRAPRREPLAPALPGARVGGCPVAHARAGVLLGHALPVRRER